MTNVIPFDFNNNEIRVIQGENGSPLFVAHDVAKALGYKKPENAIARHCKHQSTTPKQGGGFLKLIPESDVYRLTFRSNLETADNFSDWVAEDVLPSIRKNGMYAKDELLDNPDMLIEVATRLKEERELRLQAERKAQYAIATKAEIGTRREATAMATASKEKRRANKLEIELDKSKEWMTVKRAEMLCHGQKFNWRELKSTSNEMGYEIKKVFDENYGSINAYHRDVWKETYALDF